MRKVIKSLLPPNTTPQERALEATMARISDIPVPLRQLYNPDTCPINVLPWLAWQLAIDLKFKKSVRTE
ncbi:phage tail protein I [Glaciimonas sp. GG7]